MEAACLQVAVEAGTFLEMVREHLWVDQEVEVESFRESLTMVEVVASYEEVEEARPVHWK